MWVWLWGAIAHALPIPPDTGIGPGFDFDGDGYNEFIDCDDGDASVYPGATEVVGDGVDQSCDGRESCYRDSDNDNARSSSTITSTDYDCSDASEAYNYEPLDCNDSNSLINPFVFEIAGDSVDQNCDGLEGCYADNDNDGARTSSTITSTDTDCNDFFEGSTADPLDCNDTNSSIRPGVVEVTGNNTDDNCDNLEDCFVDADNDNNRTTTVDAGGTNNDSDCNDPSEGLASEAVDCNDTDASINSSATEGTADNIDQNCDSRELCYTDADNDGARLSSTFLTAVGDTSCTGSNEGVSSDPIDCNDASSTIRPGATEVTGDGIDQNCDAIEVCWDDADNDGNRHATNTRASADADCGDANEGVSGDTVDCDDNNALRFVGNTETVGNGVDNDCNGLESCYADSDNDGARSSSTVASTDTDCSDINEALTTDPLDCNDNNASIFPGASEVAGDNVDSSCDSQELCYTDADNDGARLTTTFTSADADCNDNNEGLSADPIDCNDGSSAISPLASEIAGDNVDSNCDSRELCYTDADNDGARLSSTFTTSAGDTSCTGANEGVGSDPIDCNDASSTIRPGATEVTGDGIDQNCDAIEVCWDDADNDGNRHATNTRASADADCGDANEGVSGDTIDCDDNNALRFVGNTETVGNGVDNDCDGLESCYTDSDNDGARSSVATVASTDADCNDPNEALTTDPIDCLDSNASVFPGASEVAGDNVDSNCDSQELCYTDADNDGTRLISTFTSADADCNDNNEGLSADPIDCNDNNSAISPLASEIAGDNIDGDCDAREVCYTDADNDGTRLSSTLNSTDTDCLDTNEGLASDDLDCNDSNDAIYPGAVEIVANNIDEDCNTRELCYTDADDDGARTEATLTSSDTDCGDAGEGIAADPLDCNDLSASVSPNAIEIAGDSIDQNCDSDEICWTDIDGDGARSDTDILVSDDLDCADANEAAPSAAIDCDDSSSAIYPGAAETTGDGSDSDCDGIELCWADADDDGARSASATVASPDEDCDDVGEALAAAAVDCNDAIGASTPGNIETIGDGIDNDCDGVEVCYVDADADGTRDTLTVASLDSDCEDSSEAMADAEIDCNDLDPAVSPLATELCDGIDNDCDETIDFADCNEDDLDSDGLLNEDEETLCANAGLEPSLCPSDPDMDGDAVIDSVEVGTDLGSPLDTDADGHPDFLDPDDEGDTISTRVDNEIPCSGDLLPIYEETAGYWTFSCMGVVYDFGGNALENYPDADDDGIPNFLDLDDDGDGNLTSVEWTGDVDCDDIENWIDADDTDGPCYYQEPTTEDTGDTTVDTGDPDTTDTDTTEPPEADTAEESPEDPKEEPTAGCGCSTGASSGSPLIGLALLALSWRRSRRS